MNKLAYINQAGLQLTMAMEINTWLIALKANNPSFCWGGEGREGEGRGGEGREGKRKGNAHVLRTLPIRTHPSTPHTRIPNIHPPPRWHSKIPN